jgi:hypothetical protein
MWDTSRPALTAEWLCTRCGVTNRKLLEPEAVEGDDRCFHCKLRHILHRGDTPVRWDATAGRRQTAS